MRPTEDDNVIHDPANNEGPSSVCATAACVFEADDVTVFAEKSEKENRFHIVAYTGGVIKNHYWWGNLVFDLKGIKFASKKTPVLSEHVRTDRVGFSTEQNVGDKVELDGQFLDNPMAQELRGDMQKGFPMQASVFLPPDVVEYVKEGTSVKVNGRVLKGPGTIFRSGIIKEVSMVTLGNDEKSKAKAFKDDEDSKVHFSSIEKEHVMNEVNYPSLTAVLFAEKYPDLHKELLQAATADADAKAVNRFKKIVEVCGDDHKLAASLFTDGKSHDEALAAKNKSLTEEMTKMKADAETQQTATGTSAAETEFSDEQQEHESGETADADADGKPKTWEMAVAKTLREEFSAKPERSGQKMTQAEAIRFCVGKYPDLHEKMKEANTRKT